MSTADKNLTAATGNFPHGVTVTPSFVASRPLLERQLTEKEKVERWFIEPLKRMQADDGFACLMLCFPLLEAILRLELGIPDDQDLSLVSNRPALHEFARFMSVPEQQAPEIWDAFRNGLLHRAMVKSSLQYELTGDRPRRVARFKDGVVTLYVWELRDAIVSKLEQHHSKLWNLSSSPLAKVIIRS